jgi:hypothetical protein
LITGVLNAFIDHLIGPNDISGAARDILLLSIDFSIDKKHL